MKAKKRTASFSKRIAILRFCLILSQKFSTKARSYRSLLISHFSVSLDFDGIQQIALRPVIYSRIFLALYPLSPRTIVPSRSICSRSGIATWESCTSPDVNITFRGLPNPSTTACIFVLRPPRLTPIH